MLQLQAYKQMGHKMLKVHYSNYLENIQDKHK